MKVSVNTIMVSLFRVYGRISWSSKFLNMRVREYGRNGRYFYDYFTFEEGVVESQPQVDMGQGKKIANLFCRYIGVFGEHKHIGTTITMQMAVSEGWLKNTKWHNMPEQMLRHRAISFFANIYVPEAGGGLMTTDEAEDVHYSEVQGEAPKLLKNGKPHPADSIEI
jgi:hypothetical protein